LLNYDSAHGRFAYHAVADEQNNAINIYKRNGATPSEAPDNLVSSIKVTHEKNPAQINWKLTGVKVVVDCTGVFLTTETARNHLKEYNKTSDVVKVVLSAPSKSDDIPMFVTGVNDKEYKGESIISNASCTTNCLAPLVKAVNDRYKIKAGLMTTVHSVTISQPIVDGNARSIRMGFSGATNIIPSSTGAAKAVGKVLPEVNGILTGMAFRVPTICGSVVDLTLTLEDSKVGLREVMGAIKQASQNELKDILKIDNSDSLTLAAIIDEPSSSLVDEKACIEITSKNGDKLIKLISWYDNEFGYSCRLMQLAHLVGTK